MAFVRWRGNCAELLATVYDQGRSRRLRLAHLVEMRVTPELRAEVAARFPGVRVDWDAVDVALARGSPAEQAERAAHDWPEDRLEWCHLQRRLQYWAALSEARQPQDARALRAAAAALGNWRCAPPVFLQAEPDPGWDSEPDSPDPGPFSGPPDPRWTPQPAPNSGPR